MAPESTAAVDWGGPSEATEGTSTEAAPSEVQRARDGPRDELSLDVTFELLKNSRRRLVLRYLEVHPSTTLSTLAEHVAAQENDKSVPELTSAERKRVYISLYQCHLPKFDDAGVIDFDSNRGTVTRNPSADLFQPYLDSVSGRMSQAEDGNWPLYYLGLGLIGAGLLTAQLVFIPTLGATTAVAAAVIASFAGGALVHSRHRSRPPD